MPKSPKLEVPELNTASIDSKARQISSLQSMFPAVVSEGKIDWNKLRAILGEAVDKNDERYGLNWPGKKNCFRVIHEPSQASLIPMPHEGLQSKSGDNLFIEGDNLEVLKIFQETYYSKIKMIYIDPPYNTGKKFIYSDNYTESLQTYLACTGQSEQPENQLAEVFETDGRFHSSWLNMMFPRLFLARNLLRDDGVIFISIDENEVDNLKKICNEIFGENNFVACIVNVNNPKGRSDNKYIATAHEYLLVYRKTEEVQLGGWKPEIHITKRYNKTDKEGARFREIDLRKTGDCDRLEDRPNMHYAFLYNEVTGELLVEEDPSAITPDGYIKIYPLREDLSNGRWRWGKETAKTNIHKILAKFMPTRKVWSIFEMDYLSSRNLVKPTSVWAMKEVNSERGSEQFINLGFDKEIFPRPKPIGFLKRILNIGTEKNSGDIILDFFAGSASIAQAVIELNTEDGGNRKFICIQSAEPCPPGSKAFQVGFKTISDIGKERIRRVILKNKNEAKITADLGFQVYKIN